jgi:mRNA interferase MazF
VQDNAYDATASVSVCLFTTTPVDADFRIAISPSAENGLLEESYVMVDKVTTVPRGKLASKAGMLERAEMEQIERALALILGIGS